MSEEKMKKVGSAANAGAQKAELEALKKRLEKTRYEKPAESPQQKLERELEENGGDFEKISLESQAYAAKLKEVLEQLVPPNETPSEEEAEKTRKAIARKEKEDEEEEEEEEGLSPMAKFALGIAALLLLGICFLGYTMWDSMKEMKSQMASGGAKQEEPQGSSDGNNHSDPVGTNQSPQMGTPPPAPTANPTSAPAANPTSAPVANPGGIQVTMHALSEGNPQFQAMKTRVSAIKGGIESASWSHNNKPQIHGRYIEDPHRVNRLIDEMLADSKVFPLSPSRDRKYALLKHEHLGAKFLTLLRDKTDGGEGTTEKLSATQAKKIIDIYRKNFFVEGDLVILDLMDRKSLETFGLQEGDVFLPKGHVAIVLRAPDGKLFPAPAAAPAPEQK